MNRLFQRRSIHSPSPGSMLLSYLALSIWTFVVLFPLYWLVVTSLKLPIQVAEGPFYIPFVDFQPTLASWHYVLAGDLSNDTLRTYINTLVVAPSSALLALLLGTAAADWLARFAYRPRVGTVVSFLGCVVLVIVAVVLGVPWQLALAVGLAVFAIVVSTIGRRFKRSLGNEDIAFWMISQRMLPPIAVVIPIYVLFQRLNMLDTHAALITTYVAANLPIVIWLMRDYFRTIPIELEECAAIDGASRYRIFWSIVLPLAVPGLVATFLFVLVFAWNEYLLALFLSGAKVQTLPYVISSQNATRGPQWWTMSVLILIMIIPVIAMAIALERYISRGLLVGAVKG
jgi:multiple sugar transport system permease protein